MKAEFIPKFIMLLAGAIVCIITIVNGTDVTYSLEMLLATLIIFYIGLIVKKIVVKVLEGNMFVKKTDTNMSEVKDQEKDVDMQQGEDKEKEEQSAEE